VTLEVDVVILTWNDGALLDAAVGSALESTGVDVRVIVVDNASDPPAAVVDDPRVEIVHNDANRGVAAARNQGVALGRRPYVCLLDSDAVLHPASLRSMLDVLVAEPQVALVGPVFTDQAPEASGGLAPTLTRKLRRSFGRTNLYGTAPDTGSGPWWPVDFVIGACQVLRRDAYDAVDGIDESFFYGPEDVDFCLRLELAGWQVVQVADAPVDHPPRRRFRRAINRKGLEHGWAVARFLWRHRGTPGLAASASSHT
jgi:GT2 family glycosyltransferase